MSKIDAENLTISIPGSACNKSCPYCISKITPKVEYNELLYARNLKKVAQYAKTANVASVLITGKGEPTLNPEMIKVVSKEMKNFPLELQTNGISFMKAGWARFLFECGFDTISISLDFLDGHPIETLIDIKEFFEENRIYNMTVRLAFNITDHMLDNFFDIDAYIDLCKIYNVDQMILRNIVNPNYIEGENIYSEWIKNNTKEEKYFKVCENFKKIIDEGKAQLIRTTKFGMKIYDYRGISVTYSDYCIQETNHSDDIRSLIYQADGHMYTSWNSKASRIF